MAFPDGCPRTDKRSLKKKRRSDDESKKWDINDRNLAYISQRGDLIGNDYERR
jgi:hypothetical protein